MTPKQEKLFKKHSQVINQYDLHFNLNEKMLLPLNEKSLKDVCFGYLLGNGVELKEAVELLEIMEQLEFFVVNT